MSLRFPVQGHNVLYDGSPFSRDRAMAEASQQKFDLGKSGGIVCHVSKDQKRLLIEFDVDKQGLSKTGVNGLIDALKEIRKEMKR